MTVRQPLRDVLILALALALALGAGISAASGPARPGSSYWDGVVGVNVSDVDAWCAAQADAPEPDAASAPGAASVADALRLRACPTPPVTAG